MDFFKFTANPSTDLVNAVAFRGYDSSMWVERYRQPGEFEFVAPLSSGLRDILPKGTVISHVNTLEACVVENHVIQEAENKDPNIFITGRSLEGYSLENRIVGLELAWNDPAPPFTEYSIAAATTAQQAKTLINDHIVIANLNDPDNSLDDNIVAEAIAGSDTPEERTFRRGSLHQALTELLNVSDLGVRVIRRNPFGSLGNDSVTWFYIHAGTDRSASVVFSWDQGEIKEAEYLSSLKGLKTVALVQGRYVEEIVYQGSGNFDRRVMLVDASDIDGSLNAPPTGAALTSIRNKMAIRGQEALAAQKEIDIVSIDIATANQYTYREDYDIGDIVNVSGNYDTAVKRRVVEHVEIEDKNGSRSYPTLAAL